MMEDPYCDYDPELQPELGVLFACLNDAPEEFAGRAWDILSAHLGNLQSHGDRIYRHLQRCRGIEIEIQSIRKSRDLPKNAGKLFEMSLRLPELASHQWDHADAALVCAAQISCSLFPSRTPPRTKGLSESDKTTAHNAYRLRLWRGEVLSAVLLASIPTEDQEFFKLREYRNYILHSDEKIDDSILDPRAASHAIEPGPLTGPTTARTLYASSGDLSKPPDLKLFDNERYLDIALTVAKRAEVAQRALMNWSIYVHRIGKECSAGGHRFFSMQQG